MENDRYIVVNKVIKSIPGLLPLLKIISVIVIVASAIGIKFMRESLKIGLLP